MLRIPHYLDSLLTDGGKVVSPTHRPPFNYLADFGSHFCWRLSEPQALVRQEGLGKLKKFIHIIGSNIEPATFGLVV
jgi:hypothetical protein